MGGKALNTSHNEVYVICTPEQLDQLKKDPNWTSKEAEGAVAVYTSLPGEDVYTRVEWPPVVRPPNRAERRAARFPKGGR